MAEHIPSAKRRGGSSVRRHGSVVIVVVVVAVLFVASVVVVGRSLAIREHLSSQRGESVILSQQAGQHDDPFSSGDEGKHPARRWPISIRCNRRPMIPQQSRAKAFVHASVWIVPPQPVRAVRHAAMSRNGVPTGTTATTMPSRPGPIRSG